MKTALLTLMLTLTLVSARTVPFESGENLPAGEYAVHRTIDADTIVIMQGDLERSVRFVGIDAPELRPLEPFAKEAAQFVRDLLTGQTVIIVPGLEPVDRFGRGLGYVSLEGRDVALQVAQAGLAEEMTLEPNSERAPLYTAAVAGAREAHKGLWATTPDTGRRWRCRDFQAQPEAQAFYGGANLPNRPDLYRLDRNNNNVACESLPK